MKLNNANACVLLVTSTVLWVVVFTSPVFLGPSRLGLGLWIGSGLLVTWTLTVLARALYRLFKSSFLVDVAKVNWQFFKGEI